MTDQTNKDLPPLVGTLAALPESTRKVIEAYGAACARTAIANQNKCATLSASAPVAASGSMSDDLRTYIEGMSVSVDVSTGDHDAGNRYFGNVTEVMDDPESKNGVTLLVQSNVTPNFEVSAPAAGSGPSDQEIQAVAESMRMQPWGIGSRQEDAIAYGRTLLAQYGSPAWQPIETAPHETNVLLSWVDWDGKWQFEVGQASWGWSTPAVSNRSWHGRATHWMPLPPAPQEGK